MKILITGVAGFVGMHVAKKLLELNLEVTGIDNLNDYYDVQLKKDRIKNIISDKNNKFNFSELDIINETDLINLHKLYKPDVVIHLAAQAGVSHSIVNPKSYIQSNLVGFANILECCRNFQVKHLIYASSSSVYGLNTKLPFSTEDDVSHPISLYAATKRSNELMAHAYSHLYKIPSTGLRFFTVYGPWGRPDMSLFKFTQKIINNEPITLFNHGNHLRDFTYIDDVVTAIENLIDKPPQYNDKWNSKCPSLQDSSAPWKIFNIGNNNPVNLTKFIQIIEKETQAKALIKYLPLQEGDVPETFAEVDSLFNHIGFKPKTSIEEGIKKFVVWYKEYNK